MDAFGKLAAGVAHDFNNILTAILGYAELVKMSLPAKTKSRGEMVEIIKMAERATNLTRQLLLFSRRQAMQLKELELNDVVENITKMLRRLIGEHITLNAQFCPGQTPLLADAGMLEQVLMNLAVNSRDAMPKGGVLTIQTKLAKFEKAEARRRPGRFLCLSVSDTGTGIAPEHLERIFEPFFTTKDIGKGTGLGLATVFGIVEQHKGWIEVETQVGIGTAFHIYLPYHESETDTNPEHSLKSRERGGTETILLVEDELSVRELARDILLKNGYRVFEAESGVAALGVWQQHQADIHLLVTDLVMPGYFTGQELSQRLLSDKPALKVILTSGYHDEMMTEDSKLRHAPNFLPKPFTYDELLRKVRTALD
jgi:CheY-like chemotaxis protein